MGKWVGGEHASSTGAEAASDATHIKLNQLDKCHNA